MADSSEQGNDFSHSTKHEDICLAQQLVTTERLFNGVYQLVKTVITSYYNSNNNDDENDNSSLLTPWSRVLLEKLTGSAASQEIPRIFGT